MSAGGLCFCSCRRKSFFMRCAMKSAKCRGGVWYVLRALFRQGQRASAGSMFLLLPKKILFCALRYEVGEMPRGCVVCSPRSFPSRSEGIRVGSMFLLLPKKILFYALRYEVGEKVRVCGMFFALFFFISFKVRGRLRIFPTGRRRSRGRRSSLPPWRR